MNISLQPPQNETFSFEVQQKSYKFHQQLREKHIQQYKTQIRREYQSQINLNNLLSGLPQEPDDVLRWCKDVINETLNIKDYKFPVYKIIELFKLVERFPCLETIELLQSVSHKITVDAIHELFQYDIVGLLHKLILCPEKIVPRAFMVKEVGQHTQCMCVQIIKKCMIILATLCEESQKARNFVVMNHKSFLCLNKAHQKLGTSIDNQFILCLYSFTRPKILYDEQYVRIFRNIALNFCNRFNDLTFQQAILTIKSLTNIVKSKQKWAMDLIQENCRYDVLDQVLKILRQCISLQIQLNSDVQTEASEQAYLQSRELNRKKKERTRQFGQIAHYLNIFLINYIEVSTNQYFEWQNFFTQWFNILNIDEGSFQNARRDVYFIFNNIICEAEEPQSSYQLLRSLVFQHNCIQVLSRCLDREINEDIIQELSACINSLLIYKNVEALAHDIIQSQLVRSCLEAITRNFYSANCDTKETLMLGLSTLIDRTENKQAKNSYIYQVKCYQNKLHEVCLLNRSQDSELDKILDKLLQECSIIN